MASRIHHPLGLARVALSGVLISASAGFLPGACGGQTSNPIPRVDGGQGASDGGGDSPQGPDGPDAVSDAGRAADAACTLLERGGACTAPMTGCPSVEVCEGVPLAFHCPCQQCDIELGSMDCAWPAMQGQYRFHSGTDAVQVVAPDGGHSGPPEVETEAACGSSPGWYADGIQGADYTYTNLTFRLCPVSCSEHKGDASVRFMLLRYGCPIE
jgi:hypothetical protein